jgi:carbonic anhydrase
LNVIEQVANVCRTTVLRRAWCRGQRVEVHGLVYGLADGLLRRIGGSVSGANGWAECYRSSLDAVMEESRGRGPADESGQGVPVQKVADERGRDHVS